MANKKLLLNFFKNKLSEKESCEVKGGRNYIPSNSGSYGYINWDDIDIRDEGFFTLPNVKVSKSVPTSSGL